MTSTLHTIEMDENLISEEKIHTDGSLEISDNDYDNNDYDNNDYDNNDDEVLTSAFSSLETQPKEDQSKEDQSEEDQSKEWLDILGNGQLMKRVVKAGEKDVKPHRGDTCTLKIVGTLDNGTVVDECDNISIQVGDLDVVQGLDLTIVLMELGEIAEIKVNPRFAYGTRGDGSIPPNATIMYMVELKSIQDKPEIESLSITQRRELGNKKRQRGNWWFVHKELNFATQCYERALEYLEIDNNKKWNKNEEIETVTDTELQMLLDDYIKVHNNLAAVLIETECYNTALANVDIVLKYQPTNTKALFRKGRILRLKGEYGKAYMTLLDAHKLDPDMKFLQMELTSLREKISKEIEKEKHLYAKMLGIDKDTESPKNVNMEDKSKIAKGILWTLLGASAAVVGILVHRFVS